MNRHGEPVRAPTRLRADSTASSRRGGCACGGPGRPELRGPTSRRRARSRRRRSSVTAACGVPWSPRRAAAGPDPRLRRAAERPPRRAGDLDRDRGAGRVRGLLADRDPGEAARPKRRADGGRALRRAPPRRRRRRDRRPDPLPRHDAPGAARHVRHAGHRARPPLGDLRRPARGGDRRRGGRGGPLHQPGGRAAGPRGKPAAGLVPSCAARRSGGRTRPPRSRSTAASTGCRPAGCRRSTRCCWWSATGPRS